MFVYILLLIKLGRKKGTPLWLSSINRYSWFEGCPTGKITLEDFCGIYAQFFPRGNAKSYSELVFRTLDKDGDNVITFNVGYRNQFLHWVFEMLNTWEKIIWTLKGSKYYMYVCMYICTHTNMSCSFLLLLAEQDQRYKYQTIIAKSSITCYQFLIPVWFGASSTLKMALMTKLYDKKGI